MGIVGGILARSYLNSKIWPPDDGASPAPYEGKSKLEVLFGPDVWAELRGKTVLDFGCGDGKEAVEIAQHGAAHVAGIDIRNDLLDKARERARAARVETICSFSTGVSGRFDVVLSIDSMEHFSDPGRILATMASMLAPAGYVLMSFGPPWLHPKGHHFPLFPWAHLVFTERALMEWRARFKNDGAKKFGECLGGLNQMTISKFESLVAKSPLEAATCELVPIRSLRPFHNRLTREFTTSVVRCRLRLRQSSLV